MQLSADRLQFAVNDEERQALDLMLLTPGYLVLLKIMDSYIDAMIEGAQYVSMTTGHTEEQVHDAWRNARLARELRQAFERGVRFEVELLRNKRTQPLTSAELAEERRQRFILEAV